MKVGYLFLLVKVYTGFLVIVNYLMGLDIPLGNSSSFLEDMGGNGQGINGEGGDGT